MKPGANRLRDAALSLRGKRVLVAGLGVFGGGVAATKFLAKQGAEVLVTDLKTEEALAESVRSLSGLNVNLKLGVHEQDDFESSDLVVANPAIPYRSRFLQAAVEASVPITTEIGLFAAHFPGRTIAVTGTSGKTTTTALLGEMVSNEIPDTLVGGNMGISLLDNLSLSTNQTTAVLEVSSFQLRYLGLMAWAPDIAMVTNFAPNHLDIHDDLEDYRDCKRQLVAHQSASNTTILNWDDPESSGWDERGTVAHFGLTPGDGDGVYVNDGCIVSRRGGRDRGICSVDDLVISGEHNQANACAAACAAIAAGCGLEVVAEVLATFRGVAHRLELCGRIGDVSFYNDSIATSPERTMVALQALTTPVILIAGGSEKGLNYSELGKLISERVKKTILIGEIADLIEAEIPNGDVQRAASLEEAVRIASQAAGAGEAVLLSPGTASFDMFRNFEERGHAFKRLVLDLNK